MPTSSPASEERSELPTAFEMLESVLLMITGAVVAVRLRWRHAAG
jgi:hypothetical protein